jgi:hypothetical protein
MKGWTIVVPRNFTEIDDGDSWQAYAGVRCVYVSFIWVADTNGAVPATALFARLPGNWRPIPKQTAIHLRNPV